MRPSRPSPRFPSAASRWHAAIFLAVAGPLWLWPFFWAGWNGRAYPGLPKAVTFQYSAAGFFTKRSTRWWDHHVELELTDGTRIELEERSVFPMGAFGYRTRLDRILNESNRTHLAGRIHQRIAGHVASRLAEGAAPDLDLDSVAKLHLVRAAWEVGAPELARPAGRWDPPPSPEIPEGNRRVLGSWRYEAGKALPIAGATRVEPEAALPPDGSPIRRRIILPPAAQHPKG